MNELNQALDSQVSGTLSMILWGSPQKNDSAGIDWPALFEAARKGGMVALLYDALRKNWPDLVVPADTLNQMEGFYRTIQAVNITMGNQLAEMLGRLAAAGISVIVLKGAALSELVYGDVGLRAMVDLDLLVKPKDVQPATRLLKAAGYRNTSRPELRPGFDQQFRVDAQLITPLPFETLMELHWRLVGPLFACRYVDEDAVWQRAVPVTIVGQPAYTLGAEDWVLHQAAHAFYKHRRIDLLTLVDLDRLIRYQGNCIDWEKLMRIAESARWQPALAAVFPYLVKMANCPIPQKVVEFTLHNSIPAFDAWLVRWWLTPGRPERHHIFPDWLTLPTLRARWFVLGAFLFPALSYVKAIYPGKPGWQVPFWYLRRFWNEIVT